MTGVNQNLVFALFVVVVIAVMLMVQLIHRGADRERSEEAKRPALLTITEEELIGRFGAAAGNPLYLAVRAVIDERTLALYELAEEPNLTEAQLRGLLGGARALGDLVEDMETKMEQARVRDESLRVTRDNMAAGEMEAA